MLGAILGAVGSIAGGLLGSSASKKAANQQAQSDAMAIAEQRRQFDTLQGLLKPYSAAGTSSLSSLLSLVGTGGGQFNPAGYLQANPDVAAQAQQLVAQGVYGSPEEYAQFHFDKYGKSEGRSGFTLSNADAQNQAISQLEQSPMFQAIARQGEQGILQNASATGGLRGGNVQGALAQFRPALLNQQIQQQMQNLTGIASLGQNSAAMQGQSGVQMGQNIGNIMQNTGQAQAYGTLGSANAWGGALSSLGGIAGGLFGGSGMPSASQINTNALASMRGF